MASTSGTFSAAQQLSSTLLLRVGEQVTVSLTPTGSSWAVSLVEALGNPPAGYRPLVRFTTTQSGFLYRNTTDQIQLLALKCESVSGTTVAYSMADVSGDQVLEEWRAADGTLVARMTDTGLQQYVADAISIVDEGADGSDDNATADQNVTAIRAAMARALAERKALYIPSGIYRVNNNFTFDGDWSGLAVFGDGPASCIKVANTLDEAANIEAGWTIILDGASNGALTDFRLSGIRVDGNRSGLTGFDSGNTTQGIVGYQDSDFHNVQVDNCIAHDYLQGSGFLTYAGGIRFIDCQAYNNDYHGGAASRDTTVGDADKVVEWTNFTAHDNGLLTPFDGCGLDVGRYCRCIVTNLNSYWNGQGMKFSIGTELLIVRGARLAYNLFNGFQDTDSVGSAILDLDGIITHNNGGIGFRVVSGSNVRIGSVTSYNNYCRTGTQTRSGFGFTGGTLNTAGDIHIGTSTGFLTYFTAESLRSKNSPTNGIYIDGNIRGYTIRYVESVRAQYAGFADYAQQDYSEWATATAYAVGDIREGLIGGTIPSGVNYLCTSAHTSGAGTEPGVGGSWTTVWQVMTTDGIVESGLMLENNQRAAAAAGAACAFIAERLGSLRIRNVVLRDNQATPTQYAGMFFTSGIVADVDMCHFGSGMVAGQEIYSSSTGTRVRFGRNNSGTLVTHERGSYSVNGGGTTATKTLALSNPGGAVFFAQVTPASADAAPAHYISTLNATTLTVTYSSSTAGGTNNVTLRYDAEMGIQR